MYVPEIESSKNISFSLIIDAARVFSLDCIGVRNDEAKKRTGLNKTGPSEWFVL